VLHLQSRFRDRFSTTSELTRLCLSEAYTYFGREPRHDGEYGSLGMY
jgi:hypothetical protein